MVEFIIAHFLSLDPYHLLGSSSSSFYWGLIYLQRLSLFDGQRQLKLILVNILLDRIHFH